MALISALIITRSDSVLDGLEMIEGWVIALISAPITTRSDHVMDGLGIMRVIGYGTDFGPYHACR